MRRTLIHFALSAALWAALAAVPRTAAAEITLGILPRLGPIELYEKFAPLADYLSRETGEKVRLVIPKDFEAFKTMVKSNIVDLGFCNSLIYVQLKKEQGIEPLAVAAEPKAGTGFRGVIVAHRESGIMTLGDLKGKKMAFVDKDSAAGRVFQMLTMNKAGIDIGKDIITLPYAKTYDNVIKAVYNRVADAGAVSEADLGKIKGWVDESQLKVVAYTDYYPNWPLFFTPRVKKETAAKIQTALLKLKPNSRQALKVLTPSGFTSFAPVSDRDYDGLREAVRLVDGY